MLIFERNGARCFLRLTHDLHLDTFSSDIVEYELGARCSLSVYPSTDTALNIFEVLSRLDTPIFLDELAQVGGDLKFVRVWIGLLGLAQALNFLASYFVILLERESACSSVESVLTMLVNRRWGSSCSPPPRQMYASRLSAVPWLLWPSFSRRALAASCVS